MQLVMFAGLLTRHDTGSKDVSGQRLSTLSDAQRNRERISRDRTAFSKRYQLAADVSTSCDSFISDIATTNRSNR